MKFTMNSRSLGHPVTFSRPGKSYVYLDDSYSQCKPGMLGRQICEGGCFMGDTITFYGDDQAAFETLCRKWFAKFIRHHNNPFGV